MKNSGIIKGVQVIIEIEILTERDEKFQEILRKSFLKKHFCGIFYSFESYLDKRVKKYI